MTLENSIFLRSMFVPYNLLHRMGAPEFPIITQEIQNELNIKPGESEAYFAFDSSDELYRCHDLNTAVYAVLPSRCGVPQGFELVPVYDKAGQVIDPKAFDNSVICDLRRLIQPRPIQTAAEQLDDPDGPALIKRQDGYYMRVGKAGRYCPIANFTINLREVLHRLTDHCDGEHEERRILFSVSFEDRGSRDDFSIAYEQLDSIVSEIRKKEATAIIYGKIKPFSENLDILLRRELRYCRDSYELATRGWHFFPDKCFLYVHDALVPPNGFYFRTGFAFGHGLNPRAPEEVVSSAFNILQISNDLTAAVLPFLWAHLGLLWSLFDAAGYAPHVLLYVTGTTGSMKTAVSKVLFNFTCKPDDALPATFRDTSAAMEISIDRYKDSVLLVDDFCPGSGRASQATMNQVLESLIRFYGDGNTKGRATPSMDVVHLKKARGLCVITGEDVAGSYSSLLRCLILRVNNKTYRGDVLKQFQVEPWRWTEWLQLFVDQLPQLIPDVISQIKSSMPQYRDRASAFIKERRLVDAYAYLSLTSKIVLQVASACSTQDYTQLYERPFDELILNACCKSQENAKEANPVRLFARALKGLLDQGECHIASIEQFQLDPKLYLGACDEDTFYLWPQETYRRIVAYYEAVGQLFSLTQKALWEALAEAGILQPHTVSSQNGTVREFSPKAPFGKRPRMIRLSINKLLNVEQDNQ